MKPCPFCGEIKELGSQYGTPDREGTPVNIGCDRCGASGPWRYMSRTELKLSLETMAELTGWNKRGKDDN
jgi:hypothetical protein